MIVTNRYNQTRRDLKIDIKCEACGAVETKVSAYDDRNYWDNVIPERKCKSCGKSSLDLGTDLKKLSTRYAEWEII